MNLDKHKWRKPTIEVHDGRESWTWVCSRCGIRVCSGYIRLNGRKLTLRNAVDIIVKLGRDETDPSKDESRLEGRKHDTRDLPSCGEVIVQEVMSI